MEERCHFYSTYDMSIPFSLERADLIITSYKGGWRPEIADDVIELYNIWLFVENDICSKDWDEETLQLIRKDYRVMLLDTDYQWALIGSGSAKYL